MDTNKKLLWSQAAKDERDVLAGMKKLESAWVNFGDIRLKAHDHALLNDVRHEISPR
jgi:hypothetical protein